METKTKFGKFLDNIAIMLVSSIVLFVLLRLFIKNSILAISISLLISFFILKLILRYQNKKYTKLSIKKEEIKNIEENNFALRCLPINEQIDFFKDLFKYKKVIHKNNYFIINNSIMFVLKLNKDTLTPEDIFSTYQTYKSTKIQIEDIVIVCNNFTPQTNEIINKLLSKNNPSITIFTPIETYALMKKENKFAYINCGEKTQKQNKFSFIRHSFTKKRAKIFIKCSLLLFVSSILFPFAYHYLIFASLCLIIGICCLCFGKVENKISPLSKQVLL